MKKLILLICQLLLSTGFLVAQNYNEQIKAFRENYKSEFLQDENAPLQKKDLKYLRFYDVNEQFKVTANIELENDTIGFEMQTHNGVLKHYFKYAKATFNLKGQSFSLFLYQSQKLMMKEGFEDYLFIPFTDETNYQETFGGGRYLDFKISDIKEDKLLIDFNKCYNPYCAFAEGYSCPIPPKENDLNLKIEAGEKLFGKKNSHNKK